MIEIGTLSKVQIRCTTEKSNTLILFVGLSEVRLIALTYKPVLLVDNGELGQRLDRLMPKRIHLLILRP